MTFQIDKPLLQTDINNLIGEEEKKLHTSFKKTRIKGVITLILGYILFLFLGIDLTNIASDNEFLKIIFVMLCFMVGLSLLIVPFLLKSSGIYSQFLLPYSSASAKKIHDCEAFITMPHMEKYEHYVHMVTQQHRKLINLECDEIIKHWDSLELNNTI